MASLGISIDGLWNKKKILVEANALYDTKFAKTIVKIVFVNFFLVPFAKHWYNEKKEKKIPTEIEKKIERILIKKWRRRKNL